MGKKILFLILVLTITVQPNLHELGWESIPTQKNQKELQYDVTVVLKLVQVFVTDKNGNPVTDLTKDDFILHAGSPGGAGSLPSSAVAEKHSRSVGESVSVRADIHQLETVIDEALDRKLDPVIKLIRDSHKQGPSVTEIIGGIGYIFGLVGVAVYFSNRKKGARRKAQGARQNKKGGTNG